MARSPEEEQQRRRRKRLVRGLLLGGAALGLPALANVLVARRASRLPPVRWGRPRRWRSPDGAVVYQQLGEGAPPLLLLHALGAGHSALQWRSAAEALAAHHRTYVPHLLGWGDSDRPALRYDSDMYVRHLTRFLEKVIGEPTVVVAAGLSAAYAVRIAVGRPDLVRALALVVPIGVDSRDAQLDTKDAVVHRLLKLPILGTSALNFYTSRNALNNRLREVYYDPSQIDEELLESHYRSSHLPGGRGALAAYLSRCLHLDVSDLLRDLEQPVWIGWGREAVSPAVESADLWLHEVPEAQLEVFAKSASLPHAEVPEAFAKALRTFLADLGD